MVGLDGLSNPIQQNTSMDCHGSLTNRRRRLRQMISGCNLLLSQSQRMGTLPARNPSDRDHYPRVHQSASTNPEMSSIQIRNTILISRTNSISVALGCAYWPKAEMLFTPKTMQTQSASAPR